MPIYWENREDEESELRNECKHNLEGNLKQVYDNPGCLSEAARCLKAVNFIVDRIPINANSFKKAFFKLIREKLANFTKDSHPD